ncbi:MAG: DUF3524 domain-containing protein [Acidimicrobiales bacterium]|nr:DUF3524 domain-containing protein [Acidimicrobiales bacterium]
MRIDLVEPFYGGSHKAWADGWIAHSSHDITLASLPATAWRWRMRGAAATLAPALVERASAIGAPELLVASDMIDLADLVARVRHSHAGVPTVLYLHENQLTYPRQPDEALDVGLAAITWRNLTMADAIWVNSAFHRDELLDALPAFLGSVPDQDQLVALPAVAEKMRVLPVGVDLPSVGSIRRFRPPLVVSNQRWHHDKDVAAVMQSLRRLAADDLDFRVAAIGDHRGGAADEIEPVLDALGDRVVARGLQDREAYLTLLAEAELVVSAARNEFFGIAVVEAVAAGAVPLLPDAVAYPETMPDWAHATVLYPRGDLQGALRRAITDAAARRTSVEGLAAAMAPFGWDVVGPRYDEAAALVVAQ